MSDYGWCLKELIVPLPSVVIFERNGCVTPTSVGIRARGSALEGAFSKQGRMMQEHNFKL